MSDFEADVLKALTERGMLETRFNKEKNQQELCISDFGEDVYKILSKRASVAPAGANKLLYNI